MSATWGTLFQVTVFGESHAAGLGCVISGMPPGFPLDLDLVREAMQRRAPNRTSASTKRQEKDHFEILCGYLHGRTTGTPLAAIIRNRDQHSGDYKELETLLRPGHADYTGLVKYRGAGDIRGGGHFSGRITAPLVFAGAAARQVLAARGITVGAHVQEIAGIQDAAFNTFSAAELLLPEQGEFPVLEAERGREMLEAVEEARLELDSVGGMVEVAAAGVPAGLGEPFFDSLESCFAHMMFSVPGVKAVSFGDGLEMIRWRGSEANDSPRLEDGRIVFASNHSGGMNGGISNGMPIIFHVAFRPTASIARPQDTVDYVSGKEAVLRLRGRHDACIVPRACEVVKNAAAVVLLDLLMQADSHGQ